MDIAGAIKWAMIAAIVAGALGTGWGIVRYIQKSAVIEAQRNQLAEAIRVRDETVREKNAVSAKFLALPDVRNRLCAIQGPASGCCRPEPAECRP